MTLNEDRLIEAVAKAIGCLATNGLTWDRLPENFRIEFRAQARAAIKMCRDYDDHR